MSTVNTASLRDEFDACKADIASLRKEGKISKEVYVVIIRLCRLLDILMVIFLEKKTKKTSKNSSIPPSQTGKDETRKSPQKSLRHERGAELDDGRKLRDGYCRGNLYCRSL